MFQSDPIHPFSLSQALILSYSLLFEKDWVLLSVGGIKKALAMH